MLPNTALTLGCHHGCPTSAGLAHLSQYLPRAFVPHLLQVKTVVDLRGRAERGKSGKSSKSSKQQGQRGPPPLLNPEQVSALGAAQGDQIQGQPQTSMGPRPSAAGGPEPEADQMGSGPGMDFAVTKVKGQGSPEGSMTGSVSEDDDGNGNGGVKRSGHREEVAAMLVSGLYRGLQGHSKFAKSARHNVQRSYSGITNH